MQEPARTLSPEQKTCLESVYTFLHSATIYLGSVAPIADEVDKRMPQYFPELEPLAEEWRKRAGL